MPIRSIGTKLTFWYTSILTLTFLLLGIIAYGLLTYSLTRDIDIALHSVAQGLAETARKGGSASFPAELDELFRRYLGFSPSDRYFEMFDPKGRRDPNLPQPRSPVLPLSPQALQNALRGYATFESIAGTGPYPVRVLIAPVLKEGRVTNLVLVGMSLQNLYQTRRRFAWIMAAVLPLGLLLAGGGGWLLARRALKPVDRMTQAARRISGEHLEERLQQTGTGDELDRLAKTLNDMLSRLDYSFRQVRQFSADASHELQTPLTILKGEIEVALRSARSPEEYQRVLRSSLEEVDRLSHLVEGLLLLARADVGVLRMDLRPLQLKEFLEEVGEQVGRLAEDQNISLSYGSLESVAIHGDREHLKRLLLNLLDNAIKYTPAGGRVTLSLRCDGNRAWLGISDTGIGLTKDEQEHIFHRFYRAAEARTQRGGGAGLGLCIAQSIAEAHGGRILVESAPGRGSTFTVVLPALCP